MTRTFYLSPISSRAQEGMPGTAKPSKHRALRIRSAFYDCGGVKPEAL